MKDGAIVCNSGHFDLELNLESLAKLSTAVSKSVRSWSNSRSTTVVACWCWAKAA